MAVDPTVQTKNYHVQGGSVWVVSGELRFESGGKVTVDGTQAAAIPTLTDSTGGTASTTIAAITAGSSYAQADMVAVKNALAQIVLTSNAIIAAIHGVGISG